MVLSELGLEAEVVARGARFGNLLCTTAEGRSLLELAYEEIDPAAFGLGVHRGVIFEAVYRAARDAGVRFVLGVTCEDLVRSRPHPKRGARELTIADPNGAALGTHELVIVADGSRSHLRDDTVIPKHVAQYPWGALWFVGKDTTGDLSKKLHQVVDGNRRMIGLLPTGKGPRSRGGDTPLISLFVSTRETEVMNVRRRGLRAWKDEYAHLFPRAVPILDQIQSMDEVLFTQYQDVSMYPWNTRNVVYIGDAAHAMSPQLGQGCNLALVDAKVLSDSIAEHTYLPDALDAYSRTRRAHLGFYSWATRMLTPFFQGDEPWFGTLRDHRHAAHDARSVDAPNDGAFDVRHSHVGRGRPTSAAKAR